MTHSVWLYLLDLKCFLVFSVHSSTVKVAEGGKAVLEWDTVPYKNAKSFHFYLNQQKNLATVTASGTVTLLTDATELYGDRLKFEKDSNLIRLILSDVKHSDEGDFLGLAEIKFNDRPEMGEITLDVTGILLI